MPNFAMLAALHPFNEKLAHRAHAISFYVKVYKLVKVQRSIDTRTLPGGTTTFG